MLPLNGATKIFYCKTPIHMNRSFTSLPCLVKQYFDQDAASGHFFIFFNKTFTTIKILYWDNDGYAIGTKQLVNGRFKFPQSLDGKLQLDIRELYSILAGIEPKNYHKRFRIK